MLDYVVSSITVIFTDWILSTDNALVIMMVVAQLPPKLRLPALRLGIGLAVIQRLLFLGVLAKLSSLPFVRTISALILLYLALHLLQSNEEAPTNESLSSSEHSTIRLPKAVFRILMADLAMSLDNMIALSTLAHGRIGILIFSLTLSMSTLFVLSQVLIPFVERHRIFFYAGSGVLAWTAGQLLAQDTWTGSYLSGVPFPMLILVAMALALLYVFSIQKRRPTPPPNRR